MPLAFGAVHQQYAAGGDAAGELAELIAAAHDRDLEVWIDVVYNHTTRDRRRRPDVQPPWPRRRRLLPARRRRLVRRDDGVRQRHRHLVAGRPGPHRRVARPLRRSRCRRLPLRPRPGAQPSPAVRRPARRVGGAARREDGRRAVGRRRDLRAGAGVAEPAAGLQWNDRYRDDVRGFLRGEGGLVPDADRSASRAVPTSSTAPRRPSTSSPATTGSRCTTSSPTTASTTRPTDTPTATAPATTARGTAGSKATTARPRTSSPCADASCATPGACWRCRTARRWWRWATSSDAPRAATTTPTTRTTRLVGRLDAARAVRRPGALRRPSARPAPPPRRSWPRRRGGATPCGGSGPSGPPDTGDSSRSLAWHVGDLYVIANAYWEPLTFAIQAPGPWVRIVDTSLAPSGRHRRARRCPGGGRRVRRRRPHRRDPRTRPPATRSLS